MIGRGKLWQKGSFTIEASLIMSVVVTCLIFLIYGGLYLHDKVTLEGAAELAAEKGRLLMTEDQDLQSGYIDWYRFDEKGILWRIFGNEISEETENYAEFLIGTHLFICENPEFEVREEMDCVSVSYQADIRWKGGGLLRHFIGSGKVKGKVKSHGIESEEFVRIIKAVTEKRKEDGD